ncbi:methionine biosynthesis protein MetW [Rhodoferax sp.]|uniref:methyltransferase domain-containing protein n=1 Tax=Rhodoferax sp. TaxID=50421 RepID=UPI0019E298B5|nr:methionine biosynthesis protein MetW [Rhodoferax sp.]MBE0475129.1 methyltransferase domain-containing protein [Rhodoferax sp.]
MAPKEEFGSDYAANQIARQRNPLRKLIKSFYVSRVVRHVTGPTIDLGCGAGQILERLPPGSLGIEVNPYLVSYLAARGFRVLPAVASNTGFDLSQVKKNEFKNLVLSHVLEHFDNASQVLGALLRDCSKLGIETVIIVVPGANGYRSDATHKTFVTMDYLRQCAMMDCEGFCLAEHSYFPLDFKFIGELFIYHELMLVYKPKI